MLNVWDNGPAEVYLSGVHLASSELRGHFVLVECGATLWRLLRVGQNILAIHCHNDDDSKFFDAGILEIVDR